MVDVDKGKKKKKEKHFLKNFMTRRMRQSPSNRGDSLALFLSLSLRLASSNANTDVSSQLNKQEIFYDNFYQSQEFLYTIV